MEFFYFLFTKKSNELVVFVASFGQVLINERLLKQSGVELTPTIAASASSV